MYSPYRSAYRNTHCDGYPHGNQDGNADCYGYVYTYRNGNGNGYAYAYGNVNAVMPNAVPPAGPKFADLMAQPPPAPTPATGAPVPDSGGALSNDGVMEAILTAPVHQARMQAEMSKQRLLKLAAQLKESQHVF